ncbi:MULTISPECIES: pyridoxal-phosphate dependent enzyme [Kitasatospora]|uniref:Putative cysteine synthase n=1 Tax=Kitasatospora setae (strain ATCC 33774 / DSM 43861 / JCM 3304 / KCC A-0304 / NBRC 14216 / KM-6054) TaxID=452652 RepID=E4N0K4_KITSK|nr:MULTISPECIES: pyridoxal-phosphate dependent enzyme [Kitasatospora]BAJ31688.1 putative cysteine synthase [Kitasatospora setae KM-6054]
MTALPDTTRAPATARYPDAAASFPDITRALAARAPGPADLDAPFAPLEAEAHRLLPGLATLGRGLGGTPLVPVPSQEGRGRVWLKTEAANTSGTVKSRTAYALLCAAVARAGRPDVRLVEYSGGSLALALAEFCGELGVDLHLVVPHGSPDRLTTALARHGAEVSRGRPGTGFLGAMDEAVRVAERDGRHLLLQHCAAEAAAVHRERTGREITAQLAAHGVRADVLAAAVGSGGSLLGTAQALAAANPALRALAVFPSEAPYGDPREPGTARRMPGTGGLGLGLRQPLLAAAATGIEFTTVAYPQALYAMRTLRAEHGIAVSGSGAGAWLRASAAIDQGPQGRNAVAVVAGRGTPEEWEHASAL